MSNQNDSKANNNAMFFQGLVLIFACSFFIVIAYLSEYTKIDGKWVPNTPMPTPTSTHYRVVAEITSVQLSDHQTWVTIKVVKTRFNDNIGKNLSYILPSSEYANLRDKVGSRIVIERCVSLNNGFANCYNDYFLK